MTSLLTVVLVPGMDGTGLLFSSFRKRLLDYDVRVAPYAEQAENEESVIAAAAMSCGPHVVVAESFGGPIALRYAATRPAGLRGLVLVATFLQSPVSRLSALGLAMAPDLVFNKSPPALFLRLIMTGSDASPELVTTLRGAIASVSKGRIARRVRSVTSLDARPLVDAIDVPVLVLAATGDRLVPEQRAVALHAAFDARGLAAPLVRIEGPHLLLQARPDACAEHVRPFLAHCFGRRD